jgi:N utilization substance protein B
MAEARDEALQSLYELEQRRPEQPEQQLAGKAKRIVDGVLEHERELIEEIERFSNNWRFDRMSAVDRSILKMGMFEIKHSNVDTGVIIAESIRLARTFSTAKSSSFVNGLLGQAARTLRDEN